MILVTPPRDQASPRGIDSNRVIASWSCPPLHQRQELAMRNMLYVFMAGNEWWWMRVRPMGNAIEHFLRAQGRERH